LRPGLDLVGRKNVGLETEQGLGKLLSLCLGVKISTLIDFDFRFHPRAEKSQPNGHSILELYLWIVLVARHDQ